MRRKCRIWWPRELASKQPSCAYLLFGWFVSCSSSASIDVVVAFACNETSISQSNLQEILHDMNRNMPISLQDKSAISLLGFQSTAYVSGNGEMLKFGMEENNFRKSSTQGIALAANIRCGCHQLDGLVERRWPDSSFGSSHWIQLAHDSLEYHSKDIQWVPKLHHIHWNRQIVSHCDVHVIIYETPIYGVHHFSLNFGNSSEQAKAPLKKPKWVNELQKNEPLFDLDTVILAINSTAAAKIILERLVDYRRSHSSYSIICLFLGLTWQVLAIAIASISTVFYIILQLFHGFLSFGSKSWICITLARLFCTTWTNIQIRCFQILYWPIILQDNGLRLLSCVEYAEQAALHRHSMWSSLAVDILLGNMIGLAMLFYAESACLWVLTFANDITNELLRSGCVWLMGVPAGFKLNTELAGVLGMISLNVIQVWSTLWIFIGFFFIYFIRGLALLGILFGATIPAALIIDMVSLVTLHVSTLHWAISLLYSRQIHALAALWRLFRGRKWNPLRQRLDSYDYTVKQHIVGSLLFTPLLLLLPTTSVFYIFFTILNTAIAFIYILIEVTISMIHGTPYIKIFLWLVRRRRFPSGIWFEIVSCQSDSWKFVGIDEVSSSSGNSQQKKDGGKKRPSFLVSNLHSNLLTLGQVVLPHYGKVFSGVSGFISTLAYGALTGKTTMSPLGTSLPSTMPWMFISCREYWCLCCNSILACRTDFRL